MLVLKTAGILLFGPPGTGKTLIGELPLFVEDYVCSASVS